MSVLQKTVLAAIAAGLLFACEQPFKSGLGKKIDIESPQFTTITPVSGTYINGVTHFAGGVTDDLSIDKVEVQINNGQWEPVTKLTLAGDGTVGEFKFDFDTNGIHIAAFDAVDSDLKYIYIPDYTAAAAYFVTVDQYGSVGYWTDIKLHPADMRPYISCYNATETGGRDTIKLAFAKNPVHTQTDVKPGVDAAGYTTGNWEYTAMPASDPPQGGSSKFQKVNLGFTATAPEKPVLGYLGTNIEFGYPVGE